MIFIFPQVRYLKDHNVLPQKLSWQRAQQLYDFYRPDYIPEFDAYKLESITTETEGLLKRIVHLIPPEQDPQPLFNSIMAFIEDQVQEMPNLKPTLPEKVTIKNLIHEKHKEDIINSIVFF